MKCVNVDVKFLLVFVIIYLRGKEVLYENLNIKFHGSQEKF